jgi:hypothetical protein
LYVEQIHAPMFFGIPDAIRRFLRTSTTLSAQRFERKRQQESTEDRASPYGAVNHGGDSTGA